MNDLVCTINSAAAWPKYAHKYILLKSGAIASMNCISITVKSQLSTIGCADKDLRLFYQSPGDFRGVITDF